MVKNLPAVQETQVWSLGWKIPWRREGQTPVSLPGELQGQRSLAGYSPGGRKVRHNWATNTFTSFHRYSLPRGVQPSFYLLSVSQQTIHHHFYGSVALIWMSCNLRKGWGELWSWWSLPWAVIFSGSRLGLLFPLSHPGLTVTSAPSLAQFRRSFWSVLLEAIEIYGIYCPCSTLNLKSPPITPLGVIIFLFLLQPSNVPLGTFTVLFLEYPQSALREC